MINTFSYAYAERPPVSSGLNEFRFCTAFT